MQDILTRLRSSSTNESSHELQCRCFDAAEELDLLYKALAKAKWDSERLLGLLREALENLDHRDLNMCGNDLADRIEAALTPNPDLDRTTSA